MSRRRFSDTEPKSQSVRSYLAAPIPGISLGAQLYPLLDGHLGLDAAFAQSLGAHSTTYDRRTVDTSSTVVDVMLKARWFTARRDHAPWLAFGFGYRYFSFAFDGAPLDREEPTARYHIMRVGADGRAPIDRVVLFAAANYERPVSIGSLGTTRAASSGNGVDARVGVGFAVLPWLFACMEVRYTWSTFALIRDVPAVAIDETVTGSAGAEVAF